MKVSIQVEPDVLFLLQQIERTLFNQVVRSREDRIDKSMREELFKKLSQSCINYTSNPNGKPRTVSFPFHLAFRLFCDLDMMLTRGIFSVYDANKLEKVKGELHQKTL